MEFSHSGERVLEMDEGTEAQFLGMTSVAVILEHFRFSPVAVLHRIRCQSVSSICTFSLATILKTSGVFSFRSWCVFKNFTFAYPHTSKRGNSLSVNSFGFGPVGTRFGDGYSFNLEEFPYVFTRDDFRSKLIEAMLEVCSYSERK